MTILAAIKSFFKSLFSEEQHGRLKLVGSRAFQEDSKTGRNEGPELNVL